MPAPLTPDRWEKIKVLFEAALEKEPAERQRYLNSSEADEGLREEVARLLGSLDQAGDFLSPAFPNVIYPLSDTSEGSVKPGEMLAARFKLIQFLAKGGMGEVYEAEDVETQERVAIKMVRPELLRDSPALQRFRREVHLAKKVTHPNVCRIFDLFRHHHSTAENDTSPDLIFVSMELLTGETLAEQIRRSGRIAPEESLPLITQIAAGLGAAHRAGVIHRDFKPSNVVLVPNDGSHTLRAVITDFGLALRFGGDGVSTAVDLTAAQGIFGTPAYMAPEQIEGREVTSAVDIYALGLIIYEMVTGLLPFAAETPLSMALQRVREPAPSPRLIVPDLDPLWETVILRCLERDPAKRFANPEAVVRALEGTSVSAPVVHSTRNPRRNLWVPGLAVLIALVAISTAIYRDGFLPPHKVDRADNPASSKLARRSVAVLAFKNLSGQPEKAWLSSALSEWLTTELAAGGKLRTIPEENVARMKMNLSLPDSDSYAAQTLSKIHEELGADAIVLGSFAELGREANGRIRMDLRLQDATNGETIASVTETVPEAQLFDLVSQAGAYLRDKLGVKAITPAEANSLRASLPSNPQAARFYAEGLEKLRVFDALEASGLLEKAISADPDYALAHAALGSAWSSLGYGAKATRETNKAVGLSASLSREDQLSIEGQYRAVAKEWPKTVEIYRTLFGLSQDNIDYGLRLAAAQTSAGQGADALATAESLRKLPPPIGDDARIDLAEAAAADSTGDYRSELEAAKRAGQKGVASGDRLVVARARSLEGSAFRGLGQNEQAIAALHDAIELYGAAGNRGAKPLLTLGSIFAEQADFARAKASFEQALRDAREIGNKTNEAIALTDIAHVQLDQGDLSSAKPLYVKALGIQREVEDKRNAGSTLSNLGRLLFELGDYSEANKTLDESLAIAREVGNQRSAAYVLNFLGELRYAQGNLIESKAKNEESLAIARAIGHKRVIESSLSGIGNVLLAQGEFAAAQKQQEQALEIAREIGEKGSAAQFRLALARILLEKGLPTEAESFIREPAEEFHQEKARSAEAIAQSLLARSLVAQNKLVSARSALASAIASGGTQDFSVRFNVELTDALVHAACGQPAQAETSLRATISRVSALGCAPCEFEAQLALGMIQIASGRTAAGRLRLATLEKDASVKGFLLIAQKAAAASK
jgi:serine/threonine protein kinase/tetratricopeptide (TPR) repeat protein